GRLCDRIGARPVILVSLTLFGIVLLAAQTIGSRLWELYAFYLVLGVVAPGTNAIPYGLVVSKWFNRRRGLALWLMMIVIGGGAIVIPPVARTLITAYGWRATFAVFGSAALLLAVPVIAAFLKESPYQWSSRLPSTDDLEGFSWREIRASGDFWLMVAVFVLVSASVQACLIPIAQLMTDRGAAGNVAAFAVSVSGAALLAGRVATGYFLDRYSAPGVARVVFASAAVGIALLGIRIPGAEFAGAFLVG